VAPAGGPPPMGASALRGEVVFMQRCHKCHPHGEAGLGPAINGKPLPGWLMRIQIRHGLGMMPSFGDDLIGDAQMEDLLEYLALR
jgi:mono/diheme cytochrome c family protein